LIKTKTRQKQNKQLEIPMINTNNPPQWHRLPEIEVVQQLAGDLQLGLSSAEVLKRQEQYGLNQLQAKQGQSPIIRFLMEFNQPLIYILLIAGTVALLLKDWVDGGVIFAVTLINSIIGFIQESKAENAIAALAKAVTYPLSLVQALICIGTGLPVVIPALFLDWWQKKRR
jgi:Ca2+-transporting ATPase